MLLKNFIDFNPKEILSKDIHRKISMDQLKLFCRHIISENYEMFTGGSKFRNGDTIMARITPCLENGKTAYVNCLNNNEVAFGSTEFIVARAKEGVSLPLFVYYLLCSSPIRNTAILSMTGSSGRERVQQFMLDNYEIPYYSLSFQQHIVNILGTIDDEIESNESLIVKINESTKLFYINFCNNGFVDEVLESYIENYDRQRKPLSSRERDFLEKIYPYYGATEVLDYVDNYLFDGDYLLMGEDGTVADSLGFPIVQRVNEKFWANNHTHILKAKNGIDNNVLELILKNTNVQSIITGAVQPKINQANMNSLKIKVPNDVETLMKTIVPYFEKRQSLIDENKKLNKLKQLYLKKFFN